MGGWFGASSYGCEFTSLPYEALLPVLPFFPGPEDFFQKGGLGDVCAVRLHGHLLLSGSPEPSP